jgi:hypothetical protein
VHAICKSSWKPLDLYHIHATAKFLYCKIYDSMAPFNRWLFLAIVRKLHSILNILCTLCYTNFKIQPNKALWWLFTTIFIVSPSLLWSPHLHTIFIIHAHLHFAFAIWSPFQYRPMHFLPTSSFYLFSPIFLQHGFMNPKFLKSCSN